MSVSPLTQNGHSLAEIRAGFVAKGTSLHAWCKANGEDTSNARRAISGTWRGPKATALLKRLLAASQGTAA